MKIAIVGPSPVPFTQGGIENMLAGLYTAINEKTPHQAEIIKLPSREHSFWDLVEDYYQFYKLDLSHFDAVIVSKYPAWMVQHDNCIFYVAHRLRGLYDTYHLMNLPYETPAGNAYVDLILKYISANPHPETLDDFFRNLFELKNHTAEIDNMYFQFPGPFIREIVHYMDNFAFENRSNARYFSISDTVKNRTEYFPKDAHVETVYLPTSKPTAASGEYQYIFMVSRLDAPKRIDMLIKAMKYVKSQVNLYIAGTGPEKEKLEKLAKNDARIKFLGFVSDEDVEKYYANSLVIPYFPYEEDYGLITIEAMLHHKPVITTRDSGGPTEFVKDDQTGFVVDMASKAIAEKIDYLVANPLEAKRMGENAYRQVEGITWDNVLKNILSEYIPSKRERITVVSTFGIYPPQGGGQARTFNLYKEIANKVDVEIISYVNFDQPEKKGKIATHLIEHQIPRDMEHQKKIWNLESIAKIPLTDIAEIKYGSETEKYCDALCELVAISDIIVISHPYLYDTVKKYLGKKPFIYEAQDVEAIIKRAMLPQSVVKEKLVKLVFATEKECCINAQMIMTCSEEDRQKLHEIYGVDLEKILVVPNGVDTAKTLYCDPVTRTKNKVYYGLENETIGIFMGSWHGPNLEACEQIFKIAEQCPDVKFMLMGSQCNYFKDRKLPHNVGLLGLVSEEEKQRVFSCADFALNPMLSGSGTNLKMFDYMAAGIPVITTTFGTRGIDEKSLFILADSVPEMVDAICGFKSGEKKVDVRKARDYVKENFDWSVIAKRAFQELKLSLIKDE